jgi:N utilization substance protein B
LQGDEVGARRRAREHALKILYQADLASVGASEAVRSHWSMDPEDDPAVRTFAERLVRVVLSDLPAIDALISDASRNWRIDRIGAVDRNILRLSLGEMKADPDTPSAVVIDEAVEIAKAYGEAESHAFVNGILEAVRRRLAADRAGGPAPA